MTIRIGDIGKTLYVGTGFDMSLNSDLEIRFKSPAGVEFTRTSSDGITAPATPSPNLPDVGILAANEYLQYTTLAGDFTETGDYCVIGVYVEGALITYLGTPAILTISAAC